MKTLQESILDNDFDVNDNVVEAPALTGFGWEEVTSNRDSIEYFCEKNPLWFNLFKKLYRNQMPDEKVKKLLDNRKPPFAYRPGGSYSINVFINYHGKQKLVIFSRPAVASHMNNILITVKDASQMKVIGSNLIHTVYYKVSPKLEKMITRSLEIIEDQTKK